MGGQEATAIFELIDSNGRVAADSDADILAIRADGFLRTIHLDANLTLDLAKIGAGKVEPVDTSMPNLLQLAVATNTAIDYDLGVEELAVGAARASGDRTRASTLSRDVAAGIRFVEAHLDLKPGIVSVGHLGRRVSVL